MAVADASARQQAAARLESMDIYKMLDLQGDGLIHQVVLARTLHIFDKSVFTEPICREILDSLVATGPNRTDGRVPLQSLTHFLSQSSAAASARSDRQTPLGSRTPLGLRMPLGEGSQTSLGGGSRTPFGGEPRTPLASGRSGSRTPSGVRTAVEDLQVQSGSRTPVAGMQSGSATPLAEIQSGSRTPIGQTPSGSRTPVGEIRSGSMTPSKTGEYINSVEAYTDSLVCDIRGFHEIVQPEALASAAGTSPEEIARLRAQLKAHAKQYVIDAQRKNICPLWDEFDREGMGVLDPLACTDLVRSYLHAMAAKSSEIIRGSIELGIELSLIISEKTVTDEATRQQMRKHARLQVEAIHANVAPLVQQMLDKMADEDPHTIAGELLGSLDFDCNGNVTRDAFETSFVESMQYVLGPEGLMDKLQRVNSLPQSR